MNQIIALFRGKQKSSQEANITKYPIGARVPRNEEAERIVRNVLLKNSINDQHRMHTSLNFIQINPRGTRFL